MTKMPWSFKAVLGSYGIVAIGAGLMVAARMVGRWESIALLAYGLIIAAAARSMSLGVGSNVCSFFPGWSRSDTSASGPATSRTRSKIG